MVKGLNYTAKIEIPTGVTALVENGILKVGGSKGQTQKKLVHPRLTVAVEGSNIIITSSKVKSNSLDKMYVNTFEAHVRNLLLGVMKGYISKMKVCSGHFPMTVSVDGSKVVVKNFFGEKHPRTCPIISGVKIMVQGDEIILEGINKEDVGQMAARIERTTGLQGRDRRTFQDGCFITQKAVLKDE